MEKAQSTKRKNYTQEQVENAIEAYQSGQMSLRQAAILLKVFWATLCDKLTGKAPVQPPKQTILTATEEAGLATWIVDCAKYGRGKT